MTSIVVGTAGHIDHGKSTLVRALTGIDTDRLEEEKRRGISIDLGFAHLNVSDSLRVAFIDVPGHERFIKNMLAGVGGIDAVMLVIAADESVKPQTREHFDICRLLHISRGLIVLTKIDAVDPDLVELTRMEVEELVAGSFLEGAPVIPVSAVTGEGLKQLSDELQRIAGQVPARSTSTNFRLPIDRSFIMQGFGTVVTGTVISGNVSPEDEVEIFPGAQKVRVRGVQVHGSRAKRAVAGQRAAVNLAGIGIADAGRGSVLTSPGCFRPTKTADCILELLPGDVPLKNRAAVHFHAATAETVAEVRTLDRSDLIQPGKSVPARLLLREPLVLVPGDRFIVRRFSPVITIGGGQVVDAFPDRKILVHSADRVRTLAAASPSQRIGAIASASRGGLSVDELVIRTGYSSEVLRRDCPESVLFVPEPASWFVDRAWLRSMASEWHSYLAEFHRKNPLLPGVRREELRTRELTGLPPFLFDLILSQDKTLACTADAVHLSSHKVAFKQDEERALGSIEAAFEQAGLAVPGIQEVLQASGVDQTRARNLLQVLLRTKRLIRVTEDLIFHPKAMDTVRDMLAQKRGSRFGVPEFKDWTGVSRKYAIPLLEYLDREHITRRDGDLRTVL